MTDWTMKHFVSLLTGAAVLLFAASCERPDPVPGGPDEALPPLTLQGVAQLFSSLPLSPDQVREVQDAVSASSEGGYDEEYMMCDLFESPGSGVGSGPDATRASSYAHPLRELIRDCLSERLRTRSGGGAEAAVEAFVSSLSASGFQLYWPYSFGWDGQTVPVITFDPESEAKANIGYERVMAADGTVTVREILVDEDLARKRPVWVVNANDDSGYLSLEQLRRQDPGWGQGGRVIIGSVLPGSAGVPTRAGGARNGAGEDFRTLILKDFTMKQHYDSWFRGASEFWVKCGSLQGFTASTEAELRLFQPTVTDFMLSVKRDQLGETLPFDAIIISDWTEQLDTFAFMIVEDDGGSQTSWKMEATVKIKSKSYGVNVEIPYNEKDDIVWRGPISSRYFEKYDGEVVHFGGVDVTFELR